MLQISMVGDAQPMEVHAPLRSQCHQPSAIPLTVSMPNTRRGYWGVQEACQASPGVMQMLLGGPRACAQTAAIMSRHEDMHREGDLLKA